MPNPLNLLSNAVSQRGPTQVYGEIVDPLPSTFDDPLFVVMPSWTTAHAFELDHWPKCHGTALPAAGAECLLHWDSENNLRCTWWAGAYASLAQAGGGL